MVLYLLIHLLMSRRLIMRSPVCNKDIQGEILSRLRLTQSIQGEILSLLRQSLSFDQYISLGLLAHSPANPDRLRTLGVRCAVTLMMMPFICSCRNNKYNIPMCKVDEHQR